MIYQLSDTSYEANITGAVLGLVLGFDFSSSANQIDDFDTKFAIALSQLLLNVEPESHQPKSSLFLQFFASDQKPLLAEIWLALRALQQVYGSFDKTYFPSQIETDITPAPASSETLLVIAHAIYLLARHEIMPEDLMSAVLDILPSDLFHPLRQKLLVAQDYLEERQTLVDNVEAGDFFDVDFMEVDIRNVKRLWSRSLPAVTFFDIVAAAIYIMAARKNNFESANGLAVFFQKESPELSALINVLAGSYHGNDPILETAKTQYPQVTEVAHRLNILAVNKAVESSGDKFDRK